MTIDPVVLDTSDVNPNLGEFEKIEDPLSDLEEESVLKGGKVVLSVAMAEEVMPKIEKICDPDMDDFFCFCPIALGDAKSLNF
ncbi:unnamed protein product [Ilex paraguariensis]|uniref:Uncharacterized protein n=1 Tax=Ilex paraguariensis TaxID=185542 RepID=A0ABC8UM83_9AQUA